MSTALKTVLVGVALFVAVIVGGSLLSAITNHSQNTIKTEKSAKVDENTKPKGTSPRSIPSGKSQFTPQKITCTNYKSVINFQENVVKTTDSKLKTAKAEKRVKAAEKVGATCSKSKKKSKPSSSGECDGVKYRSYDVKGVQPGAIVRFGNQPVSVTGPGDANKVLDVLDKQISHEAFKAAVLTQSNYLIDGGISVDEVQATATRFQQHPDQWRDSNRVVREKLARAQSVMLEQTNMPYYTQDAILGANRCVAPAAQNAKSSGTKWVLKIHLSQQDGGRTVRLVVNCDFQIQEFGTPDTDRKSVV